MAVIDALVQANEAYAKNFDRGEPPLRPARHVTILTCLDARSLVRRADRQTEGGEGRGRSGYGGETIALVGHVHSDAYRTGALTVLTGSPPTRNSPLPSLDKTKAFPPNRGGHPWCAVVPC